MGRPVQRSTEPTLTTQTGQGPVHRAFYVLQLIVAADEPVGIRELSRRSELPRSTVSRLVGTLAELGMATRVEGGKVVAGPALATLTSEETNGPSFVGQQLRPLMAELAESFGESAAVGFDSGEQFLYLASERRSGALQVTDPTGQGYPFHLIAPGLVAMAYWPPSRLRDYLAGDLVAATEFSVTGKAAIRKRLQAIQYAGFGWAIEELDLEVNGIAVPVLDQRGACVAVVSLYGPAFRLNPAACPTLGHELAEMVDVRASHLLGFG